MYVREISLGYYRKDMRTFLNQHCMKLTNPLR